MKNIILTTILIISAFTIISGQDLKNNDTTQTKSKVLKNSIRIQPLSVLGNEIRINYERVLKPKVSLNSLISLGYDSGDLFLGRSFEEFQIILETETRYYLSKRKKALDGWFISIGISGSYTKTTIDYTTTNNKDFETFQIGGAIKSGYQWIFEKGFTIGASGGLDYRNSLSKIKNNTDGLWLRFEFSIGYSW